MSPHLRLAALAALLALAAAGRPAWAQEAISTGPDGAPPTAPAAAGDVQSPEAIGAWGRAVLEGRPTPDAVAGAPTGGRPGCPPAPDHKPHGEVWAGAGTGGYRELGGVVTQPLGDCGRVTVMIDQSRSDLRWPR
jgi:hypothetical protein